eukprot:8748740-Pyramimonas_sp.AAC.1
MTSFFVKPGGLPAWSSPRMHSGIARIPRDGSGTRLAALMHTIARIWPRIRRPLSREWLKRP